MKIERFEIPGLAQYSYVVSAGSSAAVIDPIRDIDRYLEYAQKAGLKITHVLETHIHADFASGSTALAQATGAELALSAHDQGEHYRYAMAHRPLKDGDELTVGSVRIRALHTPGHTPEHLSFLLFDEERSATEPVALFSGDFLFVGSLGRPDLLGEEAKHGLAVQLHRSLKERIASLPDHLEIYPGHGAGSLCGSGMSDRAQSTLGYERATNVLFHLPQDAFIKQILATVPPMPDYYPRMKDLNARGAESLPLLPGGTPLSAAHFAELAQRQDTIVLDLRRPEAFGGAHLPGAINIGAGQNLSLWAGWLLDPARQIILVADDGNVESARRSLIRVGLDRIEGFLAGGMAAWLDAGLETTGTRQLSPAEAAVEAEDAWVLDVRSDGEWQTGHIHGAEHIMLGALPHHLASIPAPPRTLVVCGSGYRSSIAASLLQQRGWRNVSSMNGGMAAWINRNLPLSR